MVSFLSLATGPGCIFFIVQVLTNIDGTSEWKPCFSTKDMDLPTGFHFGVSAATGDLAGNNIIYAYSIGMKLFLFYQKNSK